MSFKFLSGSLRAKFLSMMLLVLLIPITSIYLLMEVEKILVDNLKNNLLLSSKLIGLEFANNPSWFREVQTRSTQNTIAKELFVFSSIQLIQVDGDFIDWQDVEKFKVNFHSEPVIKNDGHINLLLATDQNSLFLSIEAIDNKVIYSKDNLGFSSDQMVVSYLDNDYRPRRIFISPFEKGEVVIKQYNEDIKSAEGFLGYWRETSIGFNLEIKFPINVKPKALRVTHFDVDNQAESVHSNRVSSSGIELNPLIWPSGNINQRVNKIELLPGQRLWILDREGRVLSRKGNLFNLDTAQKESNWLLDWIFNSKQQLNDDKDDKRHSSTKIMSTLVYDAINGKTSSSIELTESGQYSSALASTPIIADGELVGVIFIEENVANVQLLQRKALVDLINVVVVVIFLVFILVIGYISKVSLRITRLKKQIIKIVDEEGRFKSPVQLEFNDGDEIDDLSNAFLQIGNKLYEYNDYLEQLASRLSHELRTPIAIVRSSLDNLLINTEDEASKETIQRALTGTTRLGEILNRMRQASGIKNAMQSAQFEEVNFSNLISQLVSGFSQSHLDKQFKFVGNHQDIIHSVSTDLIAELLDKLLSNAIDFAEENTVIIVELIMTDKKLILSVFNQGENISKKDLRKIFQSLVSIRKNKSTATPNLGLGLYVVKLIANFHGAKVNAENIDDPKGVKFNVVWDLR